MFMSIRDNMMGYSSFGSWFDDSCLQEKYFVCEKKITVQSSFSVDVLKDLTMFLN